MTASITTVAQLTGLTPRAIRYYEQRGLIDPLRDRYNQRTFDDRARQRLALIALLRRAGLSIKEIGRVLELEDAGEQAQTQFAIRRLKAHAARLDACRVHIQTALLAFEGRPAAAPRQPA